MATVAKEKQLLILPKFSFQGRLAWFTWMFVHLVNFERKEQTLFCKLMFSYFNNDSTLRVLLKPATKKKWPKQQRTLKESFVLLYKFQYFIFYFESQIVAISSILTLLFHNFVLVFTKSKSFCME
jgi:hypothetical protein